VVAVARLGAVVASGTSYAGDKHSLRTIFVADFLPPLRQADATRSDATPQQPDDVERNHVCRPLLRSYSKLTLSTKTKIFLYDVVLIWK